MENLREKEKIMDDSILIKCSVCGAQYDGQKPHYCYGEFSKEKILDDPFWIKCSVCGREYDGCKAHYCY